MSSQPPESRRALTPEEAFILSQIQQMYGAHNSQDQVFFSDRDEAALFVVDRNGVTGLLVLTNLAHMLADGTIPSVEELRSKWLTPG